MKLLDLLRGSKPATSAQLRAALAQAEAERAEAVAALDRLQVRRAELLLADDNDHLLDAVERDVAQAQRQADRIDLAIIRAQEKLREAEGTERRAELDAAFAKGEALAAEGVALIRKTYPPLARKVLELTERLEAIDAEVAALNRTLAEAGDPRQVRNYDLEARPVEPAEPQPMPRRRFWAQVELPSSEEWSRLLLPATTAWGRPLRPDEGRPGR